jgi:alkyldihydroxyacetonephosphate synthase
VSISPAAGAGGRGGRPTSPIALANGPSGSPEAGTALSEHFGGERVAVSEEVLRRLGSVCAEVDTTLDARAAAGRDWWPLAMHWALEGAVPALPAAVARPGTVEEVAAVARLCGEHGIPLTAAGGRSGVCGAAVPVFGGVALDTTSLCGLLGVDDRSLLVDVAAGTFGPPLEQELRTAYGLTIGHFPQSMDLATVGGWLACRGAGQYSTRYGKIEDIVAGLEVVLASGEVIRTGALAGAGPRSALGPDLTQLFVGSEGTLGIITAARLRAHVLPSTERRLAFGFDSFGSGLEALRNTLRRGATPAVVRLYDEQESRRSFALDTNLLIVLDEGDAAIVEAVAGIVRDQCAAEGAAELGDELVDQWLSHRNDVSALEAVTRAGIVVDTVEISAAWSALPAIYTETVGRLNEVDGCIAASAHESHAYLDGACLYFTFAGRPTDPHDSSTEEAFYRAAWSVVMEVTRNHGGSISHHHGIGLVRGPYLARALGGGFGVLESLKHALDPGGVLNPGKLGLASPFGVSPWQLGGTNP